MTADMLCFPRCDSDELGLPMPDSAHAVSACLPLWAHNIGYEEGDPRIIDRLQAAYPRFCLHPFVRELRRKLLGDRESEGLIFPSRKIAERAAEYVRSRGGSEAALVPIAGQSACAVLTNTTDFSRLREYWQHAGEVISSRAAEQMLHGKCVTTTETEARRIVRQRVADLQGVDVSDVWLLASGMAAVAAAWRAVRGIDPDSPSVQFGFPYVDTLKIQQRFPPADCLFYPAGLTADLDALADQLKSSRISAVFCETPTNPLLNCPDLQRLRALADEHGFLLVVDDTLAACLNLNVRPLADIVVTSLTKYFSGYGDVLAGSVVLNRYSRHYSRLKQLLTQDFQEQLADVDVDVLESNSRDLHVRVDTINRNAQLIAHRLREHPAVEQVWHPSLHQQPEYHQLMTGPGRYGGLLSFVVRNPAVRTPMVFDALKVCKGPNLGTCFTLCCPYTILAHYTELDTVEKYGVSRWLLRVSIGTEPPEELWTRFDQALS